MEGIMGVVVCFAGSYIPRDWQSCDGQSLSITTYPLLFKLLGTRYGGDGVTTFMLPDLGGRTAVSAGQSPAYNYRLGEPAGAASVTLGINNLPIHTHSGEITLYLGANSSPGSESTVNDGVPADFTGAYATSGDSTMLMPDYQVAIQPAGSGDPVNIRSPYLVITHIICVKGIFPSRS